MQGKNRKYIVYLSASCSGPEQGEEIKIKGNIFRTRSGADLQYTTSDSDWFYSHLKSQPYSNNKITKYIRLVNPTSSEFASALTESVIFLKQYINEPDWDGGGIVLMFAGHGLKNLGSLVFSKQCLPLDARDLLAYLSNEMPKSNRKLRIDAIIDSCYSGAFVASLLQSAHNDFDNRIFPCTLFAASLPDEPALESDKFKHGLFTYSYIQEGKQPSLAQPIWKLIIKTFFYQTILKRNKHRLFEGGVNYLTEGKQSSLEYENGHFSIHSKGSFIIESDQYSIGDILQAIKRANNSEERIETSL